jgi:hypothetical protein
MSSLQERLDFIGLGVQRSATTWLFESIETHPDIRAALHGDNKELNFFNHNYEKGYASYHRRFEFGPWKTGEYSTLYFHDRNVPERIHLYNPDALLIVAIRDPVDRAFSQHKHEIRRNRIPPELYRFEDALEHNPSYTEQGNYATHLENYLRYFNLNNIHIVSYDDVTINPRRVLADLFTFLGVSSDFEAPTLFERINVAKGSRNHSLRLFVSSTSDVVRKALGEPAVKAVKATGLPSLIRRANEVDLDETIVSPMSQDTQDRLREHFTPEIERFERLTGRDLSSWKRSMVTIA